MNERLGEIIEDLLNYCDVTSIDSIKPEDNVDEEVVSMLIDIVIFQQNTIKNYQRYCSEMADKVIMKYDLELLEKSIQAKLKEYKDRLDTMMSSI